MEQLQGLDWNTFGVFIVAMFTITNPIGALPIFAGMTGDRTEQDKHMLAAKSAMAIAVILLIATWTGGFLLEVFGLTIHAFQAAGGLIILLLGLSMLHSAPSGQQQTKAEEEDAATRDTIAIVPMAIPIVAGPGAITTVLLETQKYPNVMQKIDISLVCLLIGLLFWGCFYFSAPIAKRLGVSGIAVVTRIMGMVLAAIAFGMLAGGLTGLFPGLAGVK